MARTESSSQSFSQLERVTPCALTAVCRFCKGALFAAGRIESLLRSWLGRLLRRKTRRLSGQRSGCYVGNKLQSICVLRCHHYRRRPAAVAV